MGWLRRLRSTIIPSKIDGELDEEVRFHLEQLAEEYARLGLTREDARREARRRLGNGTMLKEQMRDVDTLRWLADLGHDVRYAMRTLLKDRGFTIAAVLLVAMSIGFSCSAFAVLDAVLLRALPVWQPERLVLVSGMNTDRRAPPRPVYEALTRERDDISHIFGFRSFGGLLATIGGTTTLPLRAIGVTGDYFTGLGRVPVVIGNVFDPARAEPVCLISAGLWQESFGGVPNVVGRTLTLGSTLLSIVGVAAPDFIGTQPDLKWDVLASLEVVNRARAVSPEAARRQTIETVVRLKPGISMEAYGARLRAMWPTLVASTIPPGSTLDQWQIQTGTQAYVESLQSGLAYSRITNPGLSRGLRLAFGLSLLVFLAGGLTLALLAITRGVKNRRDTAFRLALGGTPWRVVRPAVIEQVLIASLGGVGGLAIAVWGTTLGRSFLGDDWRVGLTRSVLLTALAMAAWTAVLGGLLVVVVSCRVSPSEALRNGNPVVRSFLRLRTGLLIVQVAVSIVLTHAALLCVRDFTALSRVDVGLDLRNLHTFMLFGRLARRELPNYFERVTSDIRALPGVQSVGMSGGAPALAFIRDITEPVQTDDGKSAQARVTCVLPGTFDAWKVPVLSGRDVEQTDQHTGVITQTLAHTLYPTASPLGHRIRLQSSKEFQIVGVVRNIALNGPRLGAFPVMFTSCLDATNPYSTANIASVYVRTDRSLADLGRDVRRLVDRLGVQYVFSMDDEGDFRASAIGQERMLATVSAAFGGLLLALTGIGLYAFSSYLLTLRNRELAIRASLGAAPWNIAIELMRDLCVVVGLGFVAGFIMTLGLPRVLASLVGPIGTVSLGSALSLALIMAGVVLSALLLPTIRAIRIDLVRALKAD